MLGKLTCAFILGSLTLATAGPGAFKVKGAPTVEKLDLSKLPHGKVCPPATVKLGKTCFATRLLHTDGTVVASAKPQGLTPTELAAAYAIPQARGVTVAVVSTLNDPHVEPDLRTYRSMFGLPPCTKENGCLTKVNQRGKKKPMPADDAGWAGADMMALDMISATCPNCKLLLVEADSGNEQDVGAAINTAVALGATAAVVLWSGTESNGDATFDTTYLDHPGVSIFVGAGDSGYGVQFPSSSPHVFAVGGTSLTHDSNARGWIESAFDGTGSGCSQYAAKPAWQRDTGCTKRTVADLAAVADPNTGVAVFDTYGGGWQVFGSTDAAASIVAGIFAAAGLAGKTPEILYQNTSMLYDVTTGANSTNGICSTSYLCKAGAGYDGPTGLGTPNGKALAGLLPPSP